MTPNTAPGQPPAPEFHRNDADQRYELHLEGRRIGLLDFRVAGDDLVALPHTEINPEFGGRGYGRALVHFALDDLRERGLHVVQEPLCPFIDRWIDDHPEYADLRA